MGTRSLTVVVDEGFGSSKEIVVIYRQFDGYPSGHGKDLKQFLSRFEVVNGLGGKYRDKVANGAGCLAAQLVCELKDGPGGIYLYPARTRDCGEEYIYTVYASEGKPIRLKVQYGYEQKMQLHYDGPIAEFDYDKEVG